MTVPVSPDQCNVMAILIAGMGVMNCPQRVRKVTTMKLGLAILTAGDAGVGAYGKMWCVLFMYDVNLPARR